MKFSIILILLGVSRKVISLGKNKNNIIRSSEMKTWITIHKKVDSVHCVVMVATFNYSIQISRKEKLSPDSRRTENFLIFRPSSIIAAAFSIFIRIKADSNHLKSCPGVFFIRNTVGEKTKLHFISLTLMYIFEGYVISCIRAAFPAK